MSYFGKVTRFIWRIIKYSLICVFLLLISFFIALQFSSVQTFLGQKASAYLSSELKTTVKLEKIDIDFFNSIVLKGFFIEDLHKDTLLYSPELVCEINDFSYSGQYLNIESIELKNTVAKVITHKNDSVLNLQFLIDYFAPTDTLVDTTKSNFKIDYGTFVFSNMNLVYANENDSTQTKAMNFSNINVKNFSGSISGFKIENDSIKFNAQHLSLNESCGFKLLDLTSFIHISPTDVKLDSLYLKTNNTLLAGNYSMHTNDWDSYSNFVEKVYLRTNVKDSCYVSAKDISYFVPELLGDDDKIFISGIIKGTVASLRTKNLDIRYGENTRLYGDFDIEGLPDIDNTYLHFDIKHLSTTRKDLCKINIPPFNKKNKLSVPENIGNFGLMQYKGKLDGLVNDIAAYGTLKTSIGTVKADLGLSNLKSSKELISYHGKLKTVNFHLGTLLGNKDIGNVSMDVNMKGKGITLDDLDANMEGSIDAVAFKEYPYKNIKITGDFKKRLFNGKFESRDENANIDFYGSASFVNKIPELDFIATINKIDFSKLHLFKQDSASDFSSQISILLKGDDIDKLTGRINFDNTVYKYLGKEYKLSTFDLSLEQNISPKVIKLSSGVADLRLNGDFNISNIGNAFTQVFSSYYPTFIKQSEEQKLKRNYDNFDFRLKVKKIGLVNGLFLPDLMIAPNTIIEGKFDASNNSINVNGNSDKITYGGVSFDQWQLNLNSTSTGLAINTGTERINLSDSLYVKGFLFDGQSLDKNSTFAISWNNQEKLHNYAGKLNGTLDFANSGVDVLFEKVEILVADSNWVLTKANRFVIDSIGVINFNDMELSNSGQKIALKGIISRNPKDQLMVSFERFNLKQLNPIFAASGLSIDGIVTGTSNISNLYTSAIFSSALDFTKLVVNGKSIGSGEINSFYDKANDVISLNGSFKKDYAAGTLSDPNFKNLYFAGYYYPGKKENNIDIDVNIQTIDIAIVQPFVKGILSFGKGYVSGNAKVTGSLNQPIINGKLSLESVRNFRVDYLNTYYTVSGIILIEPDRISFEGLSLFDMNGKQATVWGHIFHDNFKNIKLDFDITADKFMVLNTNPLLNPAYYGKAFVTGNVGIWGNADQTNIEVNLKTEKGTQFNIPLGGPAEVSENEFITFVKKDTLNEKKEEKTDLSGMSLVFNLETTPDAEIQLIFDEKAGDVIKATGRGNITMDINTNGNFEMFGTYTINDGSYLFTLENFINKRFDIENGSTIKWTGSPYNADINITANYKQRASLAPFFPSVTTTASSSGVAGTGTTTGSTVSASGSSADDNNKRYPVECKLYMRDKLLTPDITFGIALPTVTETKRQQVLGYINNEQELNRQVFSLLLLKSFVTPLALNNQSGVTAGSAVGANATEMLSNQLSNWLSQLATNIDVGVNYTPGSSLSNEELDLALSTQLFNDKLSIDGNVGLNNNTQTKTSNVIGDVNIDYKLTEEGKVRVKAFNRSNDTYQTSTSGGQFTQGLGVFFREEFESIDELYRRYMRKLSRKKKPENNTTSS